MSILKKRNKYLCPSCKVNLKECLPILIKNPWYKLVAKRKLKCNVCNAELVRRFTAIDESLIAVGLCCGHPFAFGAIKILLPFILALLLLRFIAGLFFSVYKISKPS